MFRPNLNEVPATVSSSGDSKIGKKLVRNASTASQDDNSAVGLGIPTGSTVGRDVDTTASSGPRPPRPNEGTDDESRVSRATSSQGGPSYVSVLHNTMDNAYSGGLYGTDESTLIDRDSRHLLVSAESDNHLTSASRADESQSVEGGPGDFYARSELDQPASSCCSRDIEVTGQSVEKD